jgi:hypothetical protein
VRGGGQRAAGEHTDQMTTVGRGACKVGRRLGALVGQCCCVRNRRPGRQRSLGGRGPQGRPPHVDQADPTVDGRDTHDRPVVGPSGEPLLVRTWERSSSKVTSRTQGSVSIAQCPRSQRASSTGSACIAASEAIA